MTENGNGAGKQRAAEVVWRWRDDAVATETGPGARALRLRAAVQGGVGIAIGATVHVLASETVGRVIVALAGLTLLAGLLSPTGVYGLLHRLFAWTGERVGRALTWLILVPLFYGFFAPFGWLFRRSRRDRMRRTFEDVASYWEDHDHAVARAGPRERPF